MVGRATFGSGFYCRRLLNKPTCPLLPLLYFLCVSLPANGLNPFPEHFVTCQGFNPPEDYLKQLAELEQKQQQDAASPSSSSSQQAQEILRQFAVCGQLLVPVAPSPSGLDAPNPEGLFSACLLQE